MKTYLITNPPQSQQAASDVARLSDVRINDVIRQIPKIELRTDESGCWPFEDEVLIMQLVSGEKSLVDPMLQATFLDWIESIKIT